MRLITLLKNEGLVLIQAYNVNKKVVYLGIFLLLTTASLFGESFYINNIYYKITGENTVEVEGSLFSNDIDSISLSIPSNVTYLNKNYAVISIGNHAFIAKDMLITVSIPSTINTIGEYSFFGCTKLSKVNIPATVTSIGESAFNYCQSLLNINIPTSISTIQDFTFANCYNLITINIPSSVVSIEQNAFRGCESISNITIPESVNAIGIGAFSGCGSLKVINIPRTVKIISSNTFLGCTSITEITIPNSVTSIRNSAFSTCRSLQNVYFSASSDTDQSPIALDSIGDFAFSGCDSLKKFIIPSTVSSIGHYAFSNTDLTQLYSYNPLPVGFTDPVFSDWTLSYSVLYVPSVSKKTYMATTGWKNFKNIVEIGLTEVSDNKWISKNILYNSITETLQLSGIYHSAKVELFGLSGERLLIRNILLDEQVSTSHLPKGIYLVKVSTKESIISKKILKR